MVLFLVINDSCLVVVPFAYLIVPFKSAHLKLSLVADMLNW